MINSPKPQYIKNGVIIAICFIIYGVVGSILIMHLNLVDSLYYFVITMATVGYGDIVPKTLIQRIFAVTLALGGFGLIAYIFGVLLENFQYNMSVYSKGEKMYKKIKNMENYYVICGYGRVGKVVVSELEKRNQNIVIIEKNDKLTEEINPDKKTVVLNKDATDDELLSKVIYKQCKSVIVTTGSDVTNLFIVLAIRELQPDAWVVSRCSKTENVKRLYKSGASKVVSPEVIGGLDLFFEASKPHLIRLTLKHNVDDIEREIKMVIDNNCTIENIDYHFPGVKTPLSRKIGVMTEEDISKFLDIYENDHEKMDALRNLYNSVHEIHSHWVSGTDKEFINKLIEKIEKTDKLIGINLTDEEIAEITSKYIK